MGNEFEVVDNVDVLGALGFALGALDAFIGATVALGDQVMIELAVILQFGELLRGVVQTEVFGDGYVLWAAVGAVMASCARDCDSIADDLGRPGDDALLLVVEGLEILHVRRIVLYLLDVAHAAQYHHHVRQ